VALPEAAHHRLQGDRIANVENYDSGIILFDGSVPGNFVFFVRALDPGRRFVTLRKMLYADAIRPGPDSEESLHSKEEVVAAFGRYGVRFARGVTKPGDPVRLPTQSAGTAARRRFHVVATISGHDERAQVEG